MGIRQWTAGSLLLAARLAAATYYVSLSGSDANPGTQAQPWRHIEYAMTRSLSAGDVILIAPGTYRPDPVMPLTDPCYATNSCIDDVLIRPTASGSAGNPITVEPESSEEAMLTGRLVATGWTLHSGSVYYYDYSHATSFPYDHPLQVIENGVLLYGASSLENLSQPGRWYADQAAKRLYVWCSNSASPDTHVMEYMPVRQGIEFWAGGAATPSHWKLSGFSISGYRSYGVLIHQGAGPVELDRMDISYIGSARPGGDTTNGFALFIGTTSAGSWVHHSNLHNTLAEAIHISQTAGAGNLIENNDIHHCGKAEWIRDGFSGAALVGPGIINRGSGQTIRANRIFNNGYHGIITESDFTGSEGAASPDNNLVESTVITGNDGNCLYIDGKNGSEPSSGNVFRANTCNVNNLRRGGTGDGEIRLRGRYENAEISGNTIVAVSTPGLLMQALNDPSQGVQGAASAIPLNLNVYGNSITYQGPSLKTPAVMLTGSGATFTQMDSDQVTVIGKGPGWIWQGVSVMTLAAFQALTGLETNGTFCRRFR